MATVNFRIVAFHYYCYCYCYHHYQNRYIPLPMPLLHCYYYNKYTTTTTTTLLLLLLLLLLDVGACCKTLHARHVSTIVGLGFMAPVIMPAPQGLQLTAGVYGELLNRTGFWVVLNLRREQSTSTFLEILSSRKPILRSPKPSKILKILCPERPKL